MIENLTPEDNGKTVIVHFANGMRDKNEIECIVIYHKNNNDYYIASKDDRLTGSDPPDPLCIDGYDHYRYLAHGTKTSLKNTGIKILRYANEQPKLEQYTTF